MYSFASDYLEGAHPDVLAALVKTNDVQCAGYGEDEYCSQATSMLKQIIDNDNVDVQKGIKAVMDALLAPMAQIAENAGYNSDEIIEQQMKADNGIGFDAKAGQWVAMFDHGIIDPTKVTRNALLNAASISALFITTEAGVAEKASDKEPALPQAMY